MCRPKWTPGRACCSSGSARGRTSSVPLADTSSAWKNCASAPGIHSGRRLTVQITQISSALCARSPRRRWRRCRTPRRCRACPSISTGGNHTAWDRRRDQRSSSISGGVKSRRSPRVRLCTVKVASSSVLGSGPVQPPSRKTRPVAVHRHHGLAAAEPSCQLTETPSSGCIRRQRSAISIPLRPSQSSARLKAPPLHASMWSNVRPPPRRADLQHAGLERDLDPAAGQQQRPLRRAQGSRHRQRVAVRGRRASSGA